jgi:hypothetical protein
VTVTHARKERRLMERKTGLDQSEFGIKAGRPCLSWLWAQKAEAGNSRAEIAAWRCWPAGLQRTCPL